MKKLNYNTSKQESLSNFTSVISGYGYQMVVYRSAKTGKKWTKTICTSSDIWRSVFEEENPTQKALNDLKRLIKK